MKPTFRDQGFGATLVHTPLVAALVKRIFYPILAAVLIACGSDKATAPPPTGQIFFKVDALTCTGTGVISFFIDGSAVGTETLSAGQSSTAYTTNAGQHVVGARENTAGGFVWPNATIVVPENSSYTQILTC